MMSISLPHSPLHKPLSTSLQNSIFNQPSSSSSISKTNKLFPQILYKDYTISLRHPSNPLKTGLKTTKSLVWTHQYRAEAYPGRRRKVVHIIRNQISLSKLKFIIDSKSPFDATLLSSQIKHLPSLDTLELKFGTDFASIFKCLKALVIYLPSLKKLTTLNLTFSSKIPHSSILHQLFRSIKVLKNLTNFSLTFDGPENMTNADLDLVRSHLCKLTQLRSLTLLLEDIKSLTNHSIASLALAIPKLSSLNKVHLKLTGFSRNDSNMIASSTILQFFSSFNELKNLTDITFELERTKVQFYTQIDPISEGLLYLRPSQIQKLELSPYRDYDAPSLLNLTNAVSRFSSLHKLDLSLCSSDQITVESINQSLLQLQNLPSLASLRLCFNSLDLPSSLVTNVAPTLQGLKTLKSLKLDFLDLSQTKDEEIMMLATALIDLTSLIHLSLCFKKAGLLTDESLKSIASSLKGLSQLKSFSLHILNAESIGNKGAVALTRALRSLKNLNNLGLGFHDNNEIDQKALERIATALQSLPKLFKVSLTFMRCKRLITPSQMYRNLFRVIKNMRSLQEVAMVIPYCKWNIDQVKPIEKRKKTKVIYWM